MKYGIVNGHRQEAQPGLSANCPGCVSPLVAKCGERRVWHWAHRATRNCDSWWERETEWHRTWKNYFPDAWQEVIHRAEDGEKHIADVKTEHGRVIEFQHSYLPPDERRSREAFYPSMVWVVDGQRRKTDRLQFSKALNSSRVFGEKLLRLVVPSNECTILKEWTDSSAPVFLDFGKLVLWLIDPMSPKGWSLVTPVYRPNFIKAYRTGDSLSGMSHSKFRACARKRAVAQRMILRRHLRPRRRSRF